MSAREAHVPTDLWDGATDADNFPLEPDESAEVTWEPLPGDLEAVAAVEATRAELGGAGPDADLPEEVRKRFASIDWPAAFQTDFTKVDWLPGRFMEKGQQVTLVGDGKVGKSLFALDWAFRMATGRPFMGDRRHEPLRVLYLDRENSMRDIVTRAQALGARPEDLENLVYKPFPLFKAGLDQASGASSELVRLAQIHRVKVVIIDTVSRFITGKENDADTWLQLYQLLHARLKREEIACVRLDHFGKDAERGSRGSSAKSQDVDAVWELTAMRSEKDVIGEVETITTNLKLTRTHTRTGLGDDMFPLTRVGQRQRGGMWLTGRTHHEVTDMSLVSQAQQEINTVVQILLDGKCPVAGRDVVKKWMKDNGVATPSNTVMADVIREFKARAA